MVCDHRPLKDEKFRVRITVGGDQLNYHLDSSSPAAEFLETKLILNSVISDSIQGARFMSLAIQDYFLATPMKDPERMSVKYKYIPDDIRAKYNKDQLVKTDG